MKKGIVILIMAVLLLALIPAVFAESGEEWMVQDCQCENPQYNNNDIQNGEWIRRPTCVKSGLVLVTCHKCNKKANVFVASDPGAHVFPQKEKWDCTEGIKCQNYGQKDATGNVCTAIKQGTKFSEHDYAPATCSAPKTCRRGFCKHQEGTRKLVHDESDYYPATCTEPKKCKVCGNPSGDPLGHDDKPATCTDPVTCQRCGRKVGTALGHSYYAWYTTKSPTCTATGTKERHCTVCGHVDKATIAALGHKYKAATCTEPETCTRCGRKVGSALGHKYYAWYTTKSPTCTATGTKERHCTVCGHVDTGTIAALGHKYNAAGKCTRCGKPKPNDLIN